MQNGISSIATTIFAISDLLKSSLHVQLDPGRVRPGQDELSLPVEGVGHPVEGVEVRVPEDGPSPGRLVPDAVLRGAPLEAEGLAARALLVLPQAARVEGQHVVKVVGQGGDLVGLVPGQHPEVVVAQRVAAPLVVRGHHQVAGQVVAALLPSTIMAEGRRERGLAIFFVIWQLLLAIW